MSEQRLPIVNSDDGSWGDVLNQFISKEHYNGSADYAQATSPNGGHKTITLQPGTTTAKTAPLKFTSGPLMTAAEVGAMEFLTDKLYFTQTTGTTRKTVAIYDDASGATGDMYYRDSSGNLVRIATVGTQNQVLSMGASSVPVWADNTATIHQQTMARISLGF